MEACHVCKFSQRMRSELLCRKFPPTLVTMVGQDANGNQGMVAQSHYPPVFPDGWCGEFAEKGIVLVKNLALSKAAG